MRFLDSHMSFKSFFFVENVPQFLHDGMPQLVAELHKKRGFNLTWCMVEARDVGAPQRRRRWYCIGYREKLPPPPPFTAEGSKPFTRRWATEPKHRTICPGGTAKRQPTRKDLQGARKRAALLGNAVVPDAVRHAFFHMLATAGVSQGKVTGQKISKTFRDWPPCGMVTDGHVFEMPAPVPSHFRPPLPLVLHGEIDVPAPQKL
jgi:site-specific DNA-cytosine methylase